MGSRLELLSPEGLRLDGRRANELRKINCTLSVVSHADGSAYVEQGNTKVLVAVYGPREPRRRALASHDRGFISVDYNLATFSTSERRERSKKDRRVLESAATLRQSLEACVLLTQFPRSEIAIHVQVLQSDGGHLAAATNAASLALIDAGVPMHDQIAAVTVGLAPAAGIILPGQSNDPNQPIPLLDLNSLEESSDSPIVVVAALPKSGNVVTMQAEKRMPLDSLEPLLNLGLDGCVQLSKIFGAEARKVTEERATMLAAGY